MQFLGKECEIAEGQNRLAVLVETGGVQLGKEIENGLADNPCRRYSTMHRHPAIPVLDGHAAVENDQAEVDGVEDLVEFALGHSYCSINFARDFFSQTIDSLLVTRNRKPSTLRSLKQKVVLRTIAEE